MRAGELETCEPVIEGRIIPCRRGMTFSAIRLERRRVVIRVFHRFKIRLMTVHTEYGGLAVGRRGVTGNARRTDVRPSKRKVCQRVIEGAVIPGVETMAIAARNGEARRFVIWVERVVIVLRMA